MEDPPTPAHLRLKAGTIVATVALAVGLLLFDWDTALGGHHTVFTSVRPAVKTALNRLYGRDNSTQAQHSNQGRPEQQQQQPR